MPRSNVQPKLPLFRPGQVVTHLKTKGEYRIHGTPDNYVIEATGEPAYAYGARKQEGSNLGKIWIRSQTEMEDGRFVAGVASS
jgi:uncharacterized iron-regulated membrane protein